MTEGKGARGLQYRGDYLEAGGALAGSLAAARLAKDLFAQARTDYRYAGEYKVAKGVIRKESGCLGFSLLSKDEGAAKARSEVRVR